MSVIKKNHLKSEKWAGVIKDGSENAKIIEINSSIFAVLHR